MVPEISWGHGKENANFAFWHSLFVSFPGIYLIDNIDISA